MTDRPIIPGLEKVDTEVDVPLAGTRHQMVQRLQVGLFGLAAMLMMVGLADIVIDRALESDAAAVAEGPQAEADTSEEAARDPLAEAGVVPDIQSGGKDGQASPASGRTTANSQRSSDEGSTTANQAPIRRAN